MVDTQFTLSSGIYTDEQHLLAELDFFLTQTVTGWSQAKVLSDTVTDKNIVYYTDGSDVSFYDRFWVRIQAINDELWFTGMSSFDTTSDTEYDPFGGNSNSYMLKAGTASGTYWFMANKDAVHIVVDHLDGNYRHGGFGHWLSYFNRFEDPKPFYVFGQTLQGQTFSSASWRLVSYGPRSWGTSYSATSSGVERVYESLHPTDVQYGTPNPRSGEPKLLEPVFYTDSSFPYFEVRGEVPGLYLCGGYGHSFSELVTISGTLGTTSGTYFWYKDTDSVCWAIGPVTISGGA